MNVWRCEKCKALLEIKTEDYGDYAGPGVCAVIMVKKTVLKHPQNGCEDQDFVGELRNE